MLSTHAEFADIPNISYALTDDEAKAALPGASSTPQLRGIRIVRSALQFGLGFTCLIAEHGAGRWIGFLLIAAGLCWAAQLVFMSRDRPFSNRKRQVALRFADDGIMIDGTSPKLIPWRHISGVQDMGEVFVFYRSAIPSIIVPKRVMADSGATLWAILEDRLISKRSLRRRPGSPIITNTAILT